MGIPLVNLVAAAHLFFISAFIGIYATETVLELSSYFSRKDDWLHQYAIRMHSRIDALVEIPVFLCILATGVGLALLVDELTWLHWVKICCVVLLTVPGFSCIFMVRARARLLDQGASQEDMRKKSDKIIRMVALIFNPLFTMVLVLGFWLAYHRVLENIYG